MSPIYTHVGVALVVGGIAGATGWIVNGWRLGIELEGRQSALNAVRAQAEIAADALGRCNTGVEAVNTAGRAMRAATAELVRAARAKGDQYAGELAAVRQLLAKQTPTRPDGQPANCSDAWREIERLTQQ